MERYSYVLTLGREDGSRLATVPLEPDFGPYVEWTHFDGIRAGKLAPSTACPPAEVVPVWQDDERERRALRGVRVSLAAGAETLAHEFPSTVFLPAAAEVAAGLYANGSLQAGEGYRYLVHAYRRLAAHPSASSGGAERAAFRVETIEQDLPVLPGDLPSLLAGGSWRDGEFADTSDLPVVIAPSVPAAARALARQTPDVESGGVLVGHLHRDSTTDSLFLSITGLIPARHAIAETTRFTFTPETWAAARQALALRGRGEAVYGWAHHHPDFCRIRGCPTESRRHCALSSAFFSREDVHLHRAVFPRSYNMALLVHEEADGAFGISLYGWRAGQVERRGYALMGEE